MPLLRAWRRLRDIAASLGDGDEAAVRAPTVSRRRIDTTPLNAGPLSRHASRLKRYKFGRSLKTGEHVIVVGARGVWSVLPPIPGDDLRHLGRRTDGSTVPVVPGQLYEMAVVEVERSER
jgi:hypothetical protein